MKLLPKGLKFSLSLDFFFRGVGECYFKLSTNVKIGGVWGS